ncbi:nicotinate-nucleotide adenylyltransferase [Candidatus Omnitrophota bacterium]
MRIGILGGTFDPIHEGHLYLAKKVLKRLSLKKIIFILTYLPPHKKNIKTTPAGHRFNMVKCAIKNNKKFEVSDIEIKRGGRSYSVETLREIRKLYGDPAEIFFITGSDSLKGLGKWKNLKEILKLSRFVVVKRPRFTIKDAPSSFISLKVNAKDISASLIRNRIKKGKSITKLTPKAVRDYIKKHDLYA